MIEKLSEELAEIERKYQIALEDYEKAKNLYDFLWAKEGEVIRSKANIEGEKINNRIVDDRLRKLQNTEGTELYSALMKLIAKRAEKRKIGIEVDLKKRRYWDAKAIQNG